MTDASTRPAYPIECRRGRWWLRRSWLYPGSFRILVKGHGSLLGDFGVYWNGRPRYPDIKGPRDSWDRPTWLPIAMLCCEADPSRGPDFAAGIIDSRHGDDAAAIIACDWLEELGVQGRAEGESSRDFLIPESWEQGIEISEGERKARIATRGPIHDWCRTLMGAMCPGCLAPSGMEARIRAAGSAEESALASCPMCAKPKLAHALRNSMYLSIPHLEGESHG